MAVRLTLPEAIRRPPTHQAIMGQALAKGAPLDQLRPRSPKTRVQVRHLRGLGPSQMGLSWGSHYSLSLPSEVFCIKRTLKGKTRPRGIYERTCEIKFPHPSSISRQVSKRHETTTTEKVTERMWVLSEICQGCIHHSSEVSTERCRKEAPWGKGCESQFTICSNVNVIFVCLSSICRLAATCETYLCMCKCSSKTFKPYTASYCSLNLSIHPCILLQHSHLYCCRCRQLTHCILIFMRRFL